jgi:hypothetical protein
VPIRLIRFLSFLTLLPCWACYAQEKTPAKLILKVDETVAGPFAGQKSSSCLRIFSDGRVLYARWSNSAGTAKDDKGKESRPEHIISVEHRLDDTDVWELSDYVESKAVKKLPDSFPPPHRPIDYFENVTVQIIGPNGEKKQISTREFYVASLEEKSHYPSALIVLMSKIDEIENETNKEGKPAEIPSDCRLKPQ